MPSECRDNERQGGCIGLHETLNLGWIRRRECTPGCLRSEELRFTDRKSRIGEGRKLIRSQRSESVKALQSGVLTNANETQLDAAQIPASVPVEDLDEHQLVGQLA